MPRCQFRRVSCSRTTWALAGFISRNLCIEASHATFEIERPGSLARRTLDATPDWLLIPLKRIIPTLIYRVWK
ncbi:MAG: hypothetical protein ACREPY_15645 [Rhodanobacteraceae bacterium]